MDRVYEDGPEGLVNVKINAETGELANSTDTNAIFEIFRSELAPKAVAADKLPANTRDKNVIPEQLF